MHLVNRRTTIGGAFAVGLSVFLAVPAAHAETTGAIHVPIGFDAQQSDTRANGHLEVVGTGLHIWTDGKTDLGADGRNSDKVAEYVDTNMALATVGEPYLDYTDTGADLADPGFQLVVDLDGGGADGILVGEPGSYGNHWWLAGASPAFSDSISVPTGDGYAHSAPLNDWRAAFPSARVLAFGFSLGSGVHGDGTIHAINFADTRYSFDVVVTSKDGCKDGGWATSTAPVYKNQGECVSHFAPSSNSGKGAGTVMSAGTVTGTGTATAPAAPVVRPPLNSGKIKAI